MSHKPELGQSVIYHDRAGIVHDALITKVRSNGCIDLIYVTKDQEEKQHWQRGIEIETSVNRKTEDVDTNYWRFRYYKQATKNGTVPVIFFINGERKKYEGIGVPLPKSIKTGEYTNPITGRLIKQMAGVFPRHHNHREVWKKDASVIPGSDIYEDLQILDDDVTEVKDGDRFVVMLKGDKS